MSQWQRSAHLVIAIVAVAAAVNKFERASDRRAREKRESGSVVQKQLASGERPEMPRGFEPIRWRAPLARWRGTF
jgi:hypothetical protein